MNPPDSPSKTSSQGPPGPEIARRDFLSQAAAAALGIAGLGAVVVTYQYFSPNVLFEPSMSFRAGSPDLYPVNSVSYLQDQEVYVVRTKDGFYAVSAVCTHLGCITAWHSEHDLIECPCHGSKFLRDGTKVAGPAPRPLPHFSITLTADGELLVDKEETIRATQVLRA